jgi:hypothetical protein
VQRLGDRIVEASRSQSHVELSISVNTKVTIPELGAKGMIDVEGTATMVLQSTNQGRG